MSCKGVVVAIDVVDATEIELVRPHAVATALVSAALIQQQLPRCTLLAELSLSHTPPNPQICNVINFTQVNWVHFSSMYLDTHGQSVKA